ncbi:MAG: metallophosphoesterase [Candidatus Riflebacteria bacterium]|nr:metallophosphoesterase [Candidatus Riflebacteria bacterium]
MTRRATILLAMFLLVYTAINYYFSVALIVSGLVHVPFTRWVSFFFVVMTLSPLLVSGSWGALPVMVRYVVGTIAFYWTATMMQFLFWSLMFKAFRAVGQAVLNLLDVSWRLPEGGYADFAYPLTITFAITAYGFWEATQIKVVEYEIRSEKVPQGLPRFRIVQMSDLHLGMLENRWRLERVLTKVEGVKPDLVVSTGDLTDVHLQDREWLVERLKRLTPPFGKFAVTGNHEVYEGLTSAVTFLKEAGFQPLQGAAVQVTAFLGLAGVDDDDAVGMGLIPEPDEVDILSRLSAQGFRLFLKHTPKVDPRTLGRFDLQLSGHTHGGQIFPLILVQFLVYGFGIGLNDLGKGSRLLLNRGAGTWGPPIRVLAPPEVCVIDLLPSVHFSPDCRLKSSSNIAGCKSNPKA